MSKLYPCRSKQQETAKHASSSGPVTPGGTSSQPSPPLPQSSASVAALSAAPTASVPGGSDVKSAAGLTDIKDECKAPGLSSLSSGGLTAATSSGFGFSVSLDKDETKVRCNYSIVSDHHSSSLPQPLYMGSVKITT